MKKKFKKFCLATILLTSSSLMAEGNMFLGVDYMYSKIQSTESIGAVKDTLKVNDSNVNYKLGYLTDSFRIYLNGGQRVSTSAVDYNTYGLSADYMFPKFKTFEDEGAKPFLGIRYGLGKVKDDNYGDFDVNEYGVQAGLIFVNNSPYELEVGAAYMMLDGNSNTNVLGSLEVDNALSFFIGLNYKF